MINLRAVRVILVFCVFAFVIWNVADNAVMTNDASAELQSGITDEKCALLCLTTDGISDKGYAKVLVNGEVYCELDEAEKNVSVNFGDVVEVDARCIKKPVGISISDASDRVDTDKLNTNIYVNRSIEMIGTIQEK